MSQHYHNICEKLALFNEGIENQQEFAAFSKFNLRILSLLKHLSEDKIGIELLRTLEEELNKSENSIDYLYRLHCLLIAEENNLVFEMARKKYLPSEQTLVKTSNIIQQVILAVMLMSYYLYVVLALMSVITPTPIHLILFGTLCLLALELSLWCGKIMRLAIIDLSQPYYDLKDEYEQLLRVFDDCFANQMPSSLEEMEKQQLIQKSFKFYDNSDFDKEALHDGYHYRPDTDLPLVFKFQYESTFLRFSGDGENFKSCLKTIAANHPGESSYELSADEIKILITDNTFWKHHPVLGETTCNFKIQKQPHFEIALRQKKLNNFYQEHRKTLESVTDVSSLSI